MKNMEFIRSTDNSSAILVISACVSCFQSLPELFKRCAPVVLPNFLAIRGVKCFQNRAKFDTETKGNISTRI